MGQLGARMWIITVSMLNWIISNMLNNRRETLIQDALHFWASSLEVKGVNSYFSGKAILQDLCTKSHTQSWWCACILSIMRYCGFCILSYLSLHTFLTLTLFKVSLPEPLGISLFKKGRTSCLLVISTRAVQFCTGLQEDCCIEENPWATKYRSLVL